MLDLPTSCLWDIEGFLLTWASAESLVIPIIDRPGVHMWRDGLVSVQDRRKRRVEKSRLLGHGEDVLCAYYGSRLYHRLLLDSTPDIVAGAVPPDLSLAATTWTSSLFGAIAGVLGRSVSRAESRTKAGASGRGARTILLCFRYNYGTMHILSDKFEGLAPTSYCCYRVCAFRCS